ncbi:hypothetical protein ACHAPI_011795 [Fusarium lateritium]
MATAIQTETRQTDVFELRNLDSPNGSANSANDTEPPPTTKPTRAELLKIFSAGFSFFVAGVNDGSIGALIPHIIRDYDVTTAIVSSVWLAFIHAMYMAGCLVGPFVATGVASAGSTSRWYLFYTFPLGIGIINVALVVYAFWDSLGLKRKQQPTERTLEADQLPASRNEDAFALMKETLKNKNVWLISLFFFFFLGATLTASGWVVEYLVDVRNGDINQMGFVPAGFSGGSLLGRLFLAEPTHRFGVRRMIFGFTIISIGLQLLFWL